MSATDFDLRSSEATSQPIYWHEGLFLQPHHFQWQDLYFQSLIEPLNRYIQPSMWGTGKIVIQKEALSNHMFDVLGGEFRFRDMTHAIYPGNAVLESRNFESAWKDKGKPFTVYIGIRKLSRTGKNVSDPGHFKSFSALPTRFTTDSTTEPLADFYEGGEALPVERLRYVLKLLWEDEKGSIGDHEVLPVARLENQKGTIVLSRHFIPPSLSIFSSEALVANVKTISELITSTANRLENSKNDRGVHTAEFGTKDMVFLLTLRTLNRFVPILRHMLGSGAAVHPWGVYGVLCQLVGELSTFSSKVNLINVSPESPSYLPDYDHQALTECFGRAGDLLARLMADIAADPEYVAPFTYDGQNFSVVLPDTFVKGSKRYYLAVETDGAAAEVIAELENQAKMSSLKHLALLTAQSLPGIDLTHISHPPPELPRRNSGLYFSIDHKSRLWQKVVEEKILALSWPTRPENARIELMVSGRNA
jgi:type VI secretion system protein ImpJ